eukprot:scaffold6348_cov259-Pinguiococcus_pyrenoidosus.AAC.2
MPIRFFLRGLEGHDERRLLRLFAGLCAGLKVHSTSDLKPEWQVFGVEASPASGETGPSETRDSSLSRPRAKFCRSGFLFTPFRKGLLRRSSAAVGRCAGS